MDKFDEDFHYALHFRIARTLDMAFLKAIARESQKIDRAND